MSQHPHRVKTLERVYGILRDACSLHPMIAQYDSGSEQEYGADYLYPLAYLETINEIQENDESNRETYSVALNLLDYIPEEANGDTRVQGHDKLKQLFTEIKTYLMQESVFGKKNISGASLLLMDDFSNDKVIRLRAEFTITVKTQVSSLPDIRAIYSLNPTAPTQPEPIVIEPIEFPFPIQFPPNDNA